MLLIRPRRLAALDQHLLQHAALDERGADLARRRVDQDLFAFHAHPARRALGRSRAAPERHAAAGEQRRRLEQRQAHDAGIAAREMLDEHRPPVPGFRSRPPCRAARRCDSTPRRSSAVVARNRHFAARRAASRPNRRSAARPRSARDACGPTAPRASPRPRPRRPACRARARRARRRCRPRARAAARPPARAPRPRRPSRPRAAGRRRRAPRLRPAPRRSRPGAPRTARRFGAAARCAAAKPRRDRRNPFSFKRLYEGFANAPSPERPPRRGGTDDSVETTKRGRAPRPRRRARGHAAA